MRNRQLFKFIELETFKLILDYSDTYAPAIVLILLSIAGKRTPAYSFFLFFYLIVTITVFFASNWMAFYKQNNLFLYHFSTLFSFCAVSFFIYRNIQTASRKQLVVLLSALFLVFFTCDILFWERLDEFNINSATANCLLLSFFSIVYYIDVIESPSLLFLKQQFPFWFITGCFLYSFITLFVFLIYKPSVISHFPFLRKIIWLIQDVSLLIQYSMIALGIVCSRKNSP